MCRLVAEGNAIGIVSPKRHWTERPGMRSRHYPPEDLPCFLEVPFWTLFEWLSADLFFISGVWLEGVRSPWCGGVWWVT